MTITLAILRRYFMQVGFAAVVTVLCVTILHQGKIIEDQAVNLAIADFRFKNMKASIEIQNSAVDAIDTQGRERATRAAEAVTAATSSRRVHEATSQRILTTKPASGEACAAAEPLIDQYRGVGS